MYDQITANKRKTWLLMAVFGALIIGIGLSLQLSGRYGYESVVFAVLVSAIMSIGSYFGGDKMALWSSHAVHIKKEEAPALYRTVENLCIANGQPMPKIHIIQSSALNAFATGRDPEHASIAVTTGLIEALENEELEGVLAHELSHIKNYDIRVMTVVVVLVGAIALLGDWFLRVNLSGGRDRENKNGSLFAILGIAFLVVSPLVAELIKLAISRRREYLADASGALLTRYPEGLARALEKISQSTTPLATASNATAHLFIANPFKTKSVMALFSTHPPVAERIKRLRDMA